MKKILPALVILIGLCMLITLAALPAFAQQGVPIGPGGPGNATSIGGLAVMAALGGGYALKKLRDRKRG